MCVGQYAYLRVHVCVATTFYTKDCILSLFILGVALQIVTCHLPLHRGGFGWCVKQQFAAFLMERDMCDFRFPRPAKMPGECLAKKEKIYLLFGFHMVTCIW